MCVLKLPKLTCESFREFIKTTTTKKTPAQVAAVVDPGLLMTVNVFMRDVTFTLPFTCLHQWWSTALVFIGKWWLQWLPHAERRSSHCQGWIWLENLCLADLAWSDLIYFTWIYFIFYLVYILIMASINQQNMMVSVQRSDLKSYWGVEKW